MKIGLMHYHLKTGGVTTCVKNQVEALKSDCDVCVITGELPQAGFPAKTIHIPELAYSADYHSSFNPEKVAAVVVRSIESHFGGPCDIVHVHNPILAKNKSFLKILKALQKVAYHYSCRFMILPKTVGRGRILRKTTRRIVITVSSTLETIGFFLKAG